MKDCYNEIISIEGVSLRMINGRKIISRGEKLKTLRKKYNVKQEELAGNDITRNLISMVESNKINLTRATAEVVIKNLNEIASKRNLKVTETVEYIIEDELSQAEQIVDDYINELKSLIICKNGCFVNTLNEVEDFLIQWDIKDKKIEIYELAGDYYCNSKNYRESSLYYERARELITKSTLNETLISVLRKLSMVYIYTGQSDACLECCNFALNHFNDMTKDHKAVFLYNGAIAYRELKNYDLALQNICTLENIIDKTNQAKFFDILNLKAACLKERSAFKDSLKVYDNILGILEKDDFEKRIMTYINICDVHITIKNRDKVVEKFEDIKELLYKINDNDDYITDICFEVGNIYKYLDCLEKAEEYYTRALKSARLRREYVLENNILCALIDIYSVLKNTEKIDRLKLEFFSLSNNQMNINNVIMCKLINFYNEKTCTEKIKEISNFVLQFSV